MVVIYCEELDKIFFNGNNNDSGHISFSTDLIIASHYGDDNDNGNVSNNFKLLFFSYEDLQHTLHTPAENLFFLIEKLEREKAPIRAFMENIDFDVRLICTLYSHFSMSSLNTFSNKWTKKST